MIKHQWACVFDEGSPPEYIKERMYLPDFVVEFIIMKAPDNEDLRAMYYCERCGSICFYRHYGPGSNWYEDCDITIIAL